MFGTHSGVPLCVRQDYGRAYGNSKNCPRGLAKNTMAVCLRRKPKNGKSASPFREAQRCTLCLSP